MSEDNLGQYTTCTKEKCIVNVKDKNRGLLVCRKCTREVHYICSELPPYQIQLCLTSKSRSFQCQNCVKVPEEIKQKCLHQEKHKIEKLEKEVTACENIIKVQTETTSRLVQQSKETKNIEKKLEDLKVTFETSLNGKVKELEKLFTGKIAEVKKY